LGCHSESRDPRPTPLRVTAGVVALLAMAVLGTAGCSAQTAVTRPPPAATSTRVAPSTSSTNTQTPTPSPVVVGAANLARSVPVRLQIAAIGVDSRLMDLGLKADGTMQVPPSGFPAGWYTGMPTPGQLGPAIIVGHVDWKGPGVFYNLHKLKPGELVAVTRTDGSKPVFRVTRVQQFPKDQFPTKAVYGPLDHAGLRLITCGGTFNTQTGHYEDNIVAFADLVSPPQ
jgi:Sortase domain